MQNHWLNKINNRKLIVFLAGWSFDFIPFEFLDCKDFDVLFVYDYNEFNFCEDFTEYSEKYLLTWSMGTYVGYLLKDCFDNFNKRIAINGTPYPVHENFGIPLKPFLLTLKHAKIGLEGKFYQNIFNSENEFERYLTTPVSRTIENRESELKSLYNHIKSNEIEYNNFYDFALISNNDKIIPSKNQVEFWKNNASYKTIESGHFPFYNFKSWEDIINLAE